MWPTWVESTSRPGEVRTAGARAGEKGVKGANCQDINMLNYVGIIHYPYPSVTCHVSVKDTHYTTVTIMPVFLRLEAATAVSG
jgi:hypothetical protein